MADEGGISTKSVLGSQKTKKTIFNHIRYLFLFLLLLFFNFPFKLYRMHWEHVHKKNYDEITYLSLNTRVQLHYHIKAKKELNLYVEYSRTVLTTYISIVSM